MPSSKDHYERVLSPVYSWMYGGIAAGVERNAAFFAEHGVGAPQGSGRAVDLGAGSGFQTVPLARLGYAVTAIDLDHGLLEELKTNAHGLPVVPIEDDLRSFRDHIDAPIELTVCMTDTLLHLDSRDDVRALLADVHAALEPGGRFIATLRDLTRELTELDRFIPIRNDESTIFTCFLEYEPETVKVHDLVYRRGPEGWQLGKSFYRKLRLSSDWICDALRAVGFRCADAETSGGLTTIIAARG